MSRNSLPIWELRKRVWNTEEPGKLKGVVTDGDGRPIKGASVETFLGLGSPRPEVRVSGEDGSFEFESIAPGNHFVRVSAMGFMVCTQDVNVPRGQVVQVVLKLERGLHEIRGRIAEDEKTPLRAEVTLLRRGIVIQKGTTEEKRGTYHFRYLTEGFYELQATSICHMARGWGGNVSGPTKVDLVLPVVEGCTTHGVCDVCGEIKEVRYCKFCHAFICNDCRHNYPERMKAMIRRRLGRKASSKDVDAQSIYESELKESPPSHPCGNCP